MVYGEIYQKVITFFVVGFCTLCHFFTVISINFSRILSFIFSSILAQTLIISRHFLMNESKKKWVLAHCDS